MTYDELMERARIEAWRRISALSNLHSDSCGDDCYNPAHYPSGNPLDGGHSEMALDFLGERDS